jgi:urease accessory protein
VCASAGIGVRAAVEGYMYTRLSATVSAAMRLMAIGQRDAHALLAETLSRVPAATDAVESCPLTFEALGGFAPALDLSAMSQPHLRSRLFLS